MKTQKQLRAQAIGHFATAAAGFTAMVTASSLAQGTNWPKTTLAVIVGGMVVTTVCSTLGIVKSDSAAYAPK